MTDAEIMGLPAGPATDRLIAQARAMLAGREVRDGEEAVSPFILLHEGRWLTKVAAMWAEDDDGCDGAWWVKIGEHEAHGPFPLTCGRLYLMAARDALLHRQMQ